MRLPSVAVNDGAIDFDSTSLRPADVDCHRTRAAFTCRRPAASRLPFHYHLVPPRLRMMIASVIGRAKRNSIDKWARFPMFPIDLSADFLADMVGDEPSLFLDQPTPVCLSHDLDSAEGLRNAIGMFFDIEQSVEARSTNFIVPCAWPVDHGLLDEARSRGHDIGVHGFDHSNRTAFAEQAERLERLKGASELIERYGVTGYRAPSLLRTPELLRDLAGFYRYDSSIPTAGGLFPVPNNGCASARPFMCEGIIELPISMPRDGSLRFLGYAPDKIAGTWIECAKAIAASGGVVMLVTHCEARFSGNDGMLGAYRRFLEFVASDDRFAFALPQQVLDTATGES